MANRPNTQAAPMDEGEGARMAKEIAWLREGLMRIVRMGEREKRGTRARFLGSYALSVLNKTKKGQSDD